MSTTNMYRPLGVDFLKTWDVPWIRPDERVAASATEEARKIKRDIARRHLAALCRYEEELLELVDRDAVQVVYSQLGLAMPVPTSVSSQPVEGEDSNGIDALRAHDADYETVLFARSRFHPDKKVREEAVASLKMVDKQEIEEWQSTAPDWGANATDCGTVGAEDTPANSGDISDTGFEWVGSQGQQTLWQDDAWSDDEVESQQSIGSEEELAADDELTACGVCEPHPGLPISPPSELSSTPSSPTCPLKHDALHGTGISCTIEELATVLNDKKILTIYLARIDEGIRKVRKTKAEKDEDREKTRQLYSRAAQRPRDARGQDGEWRWRQGSELAEGKPLRWFEYEKRHIYDESSGKWELTVERQGQNYMLAKASDPETLDRARKKSKTPPARALDWNLDTVPAWAGMSCSGWFEKEL